MTGSPKSAETRTVHPDGSYEIALWQDADGNPTGYDIAERCEITRFDADGTVVERTYAVITDGGGISFTPGSNPERFVGDGDDLDWDPPAA